MGVGLVGFEFLEERERGNLLCKEEEEKPSSPVFTPQ
jgi:hypothetical protein